MTTKRTKKFDQTLQKALELHDKGKPIAEILSRFPEHQHDLKEIFKCLKLLKENKNDIKPSKKLLSEIIDVTNLKNIRYSLLERFNSIITNAMKKRTYAMVSATLLLVVVASGIYMKLQGANILPSESDLRSEVKSLNQDISFMDEQDQNLNDLSQNLNELASDSTLIADMAAEIDADLESLNEDLNTLDEFSNSTLQNLDNEMSEITI